MKHIEALELWLTTNDEMKRLEIKPGRPNSQLPFKFFLSAHCIGHLIWNRQTKTLTHPVDLIPFSTDENMPFSFVLIKISIGGS